MKTYSTGVSKERKRWPNQVRSLKGMKIGYSYTKVYAIGERPFKDRGLVLDRIEFNEELQDMKLFFNGSNHCMYAADANLIPYRNGEWNNTNYFVRERKR
jgi:hypothetical protein